MLKMLWKSSKRLDCNVLHFPVNKTNLQSSAFIGFYEFSFNEMKD